MTLLELVITCAVLIIVAGGGWFATTALMRGMVRMEAQALANSIARLAILACAQNSAHFLWCDTQGNRHITSSGIERSLAPGVVFGAPASIFGPPSNPVGPISRPVTFAGNRIVAHANGTLSAGALYVTDRMGSCCYAVTVAPRSYRLVHLYRWLAGRWERL